MPPRGLLRGQIGGWNVSGSWNQSGFMEVLKVVSGTYRATPFFTVYVGADSKSSNSNVIQVGTRGCGHRGGHWGAAGCPYRPSAPSPGGPVGAFPPLPGLLPEQDGQRAGERGESPPRSWCRGGARPGPMGGGVPRMGLSRPLGSRQVLAAYLDYMVELGTLLGGAKEPTRLQMQQVLDFETLLANITVPQAERRDDEKIYHKMSIAELQVGKAGEKKQTKKKLWGPLRVPSSSCSPGGGGESRGRSFWGRAGIWGAEGAGDGRAGGCGAVPSTRGGHIPVSPRCSPPPSTGWITSPTPWPRWSWLRRSPWWCTGTPTSSRSPSSSTAPTRGETPGAEPSVGGTGHRPPPPAPCRPLCPRSVLNNYLIWNLVQKTASSLDQRFETAQERLLETLYGTRKVTGGGSGTTPRHPQQRGGSRSASALGVPLGC